MCKAWQGPKNGCIRAYRRLQREGFHLVRQHLRRTFTRLRLRPSALQLDFGF